MSAPAVVIGIGNPDRRDDGVGPAVARLAARRLPGVTVMTCPAEPTAVLDAWDGAALAVIVDAAAGGTPGRVRRCALGDLVHAAPVSSHDLQLGQIWELGQALGRAPGAAVVVAVDVADTGYGQGLSPAVSAALPEAARTVTDLVLQLTQEPSHQQP